MNLQSSITGQTAHAGGVTIYINLVGLQELDALLASMEDPSTRVAAALYRIAERIMAASKLLTPVKTGALRASGHVQLPVITASMVSVSLGFGGPSIPYALRQHETPPDIYHHRVGQWKFLEQPMQEAQATLPADLAAEMKEAA